MDFKLDAEIQTLLPKHSAEEYDQLEANILEGLHVDPLVVFKIEGADNILGDGYTRHSICTKHGIPFTTRTKKFPSREAALQWVIDNQLGRRNLTDERRAYYRGKDYLLQKQAHGDTDRFPRGQNDPLGKTLEKSHISTAEEVAEKHGVSPKTVKRDADFAEAVDALEPAAKETVLTGESGMTKEEVAARKKILCRHCERRLNKNAPLIVNCEDCAELRKVLKPKREPKEKEPEAEEPLKDDSGAIVPIRLLPVFQEVAVFAEAERALTACAKVFKRLETGPAKDAKPVDPKAAFTRYFPTFKSAREKVQNMRPSLVCSDCLGDGCTRCRNLGWLTREMAGS